jgi:hypothetical protein
MEMKLVIIFAIIIATFFGAAMCCSFFKLPSEDYERLADEITAKTAKKLKDEKGLILIGTGGQMMDDIQMMMMGFEYRKVVTVETARKLLVESVEEYLSAINASTKIQPHLHNSPFTAKNVEIVIYFRNQDGTKVPLDKIKIASANEGEMFYYVDYPEKYTLKAIHKETYEEAVQTLAHQK